MAGESEEESSNRAEIMWEASSNPPQKSDYIFRNGRRYVMPYYFEFIAYVKNRWEGKPIVDLFSEEFRGRSHDYYVNAISKGRIQVDGKMVCDSYTVKSSEKLSHFVHRHEPPVTALDISILHIDPDVLVVCKPPTMPVHPCGQYRKNSVLGILQAEHGLMPLFPVHRLDRLVSGLLILARNSEKADLFRREIEAEAVQKQYVAKVLGIFPEEEQEVVVNINYNAREGKSTAEVRCNDDVCAIMGKYACTKLRRISTDGVHSIVSCAPVTGRTHQIRVHLKYIGHPIANDYLYRPEGISPTTKRSFSHPRVEESDGNQKWGFEIDPMCTNCPSLAPKGYSGHEEGLWLHCVRYSGPGWDYNCPSPGWAVLS